MNPAPSYTAAEISRAACAHSETRISRQAVAKLLLDVPASSVRPQRGNPETPVWTLASLPVALREKLELAARKSGFRNAEMLLATPARPWFPAAPLAALADDEVTRAAQLREVLKPLLQDQSRPAAERDALIVARYGDACGQVITADYARKLYQRTITRDRGASDWCRLEIYLSDNPRLKQAPEWKLAESHLAEVLPALESRIASIQTPAHPPKLVVRAVWHVAFEEYTRLISEGSPAEKAARLVRSFLHVRAPFLPRNRDTLLKAWNDKLARWLAREGTPGALGDLRGQNGQRVEIAEADIARLRWSAMTKHSGRLDCAWREEFDTLSEPTRAHGTKQGRCPRVVVNAVNRVILDGLTERRRGKRYLEKLLGTVLRDLSNVPAMYAWVMDDLTCTLEVYVINADGTTSLRLIQFIAVLDVRSRRVVGWAASLDEAPSAELVCEAFLDAVRRTKKVPHHLFLENGWVFGRAGNVVGKRDESGDVVIAGLAEYGCQVHHFDPQTPTAKGELEKTFDLLQQRMERHPGYTGREQRHDAPEQFRREQIEMRRKSNPRDPQTCRYDFPQGVRAIEKIIAEHNATPQRGQLAGRTPDQAFVELQDRENPPTWLPDKLHWLLAYKYRVPITHSGAAFTHFGQKIRVRGGKLASADRIGREFWAVLDSRHADCVTFMSLDFSDVFTEPLRPVVPYDISETAPESDALATEYRTKAEHRQVIESEYQGLIDRFGDPRKELLREAQATSEALELDAGIGMNARLPLVDSNLRAAGEEGQRQRAELRRKSKPNPARQAKPGSMAARPGIAEARAAIFGQPSKETAT